MIRRFVPLVVVVILSSCQSGLIPCPTVKGDKLVRSNPGHRPYAAVTARAEEEEVSGNKANKSVRNQESRFIRNVTEEEWDCPEPGKKRYMPRHVKANIRRNFKMMNEEQRQAPADSTDSSRK